MNLNCLDRVCTTAEVERGRERGKDGVRDRGHVLAEKILTKNTEGQKKLQWRKRPTKRREKERDSETEIEGERKKIFNKKTDCHNKV